jgi:magnesium transporter
MELLEGRKWSELRESLADWHASDLAELLLGIEKPEQLPLFRVLPRELSPEVFSHLEPTARDDLVQSLTDEETQKLLSDLSPDDRTQFFEDLPGQAIQRLTHLLSPQDRMEALELLGYPEESVGRHMTPDYVAVRPFWSIGQSLEHIRRMGKDSETINVIYVTDASWKLLDALELRKFILADPDEKVETIMDYTFQGIPATSDREEGVQLVQRYDLNALPVLDPMGVMLGIVTVDDILDVIEEEVTEDFHKTAAVAPLKLSYHESSVLSLFSKRIGWLVILVFVNLVASGVIAAYEELLASAIVLAFFIPLLNAGGGNVGAQSATLIIRAQTTGDVKLNQWLETAAKELKVGVFIGLSMGLMTWVLGYFYGGADIALIAGVSMLLIVVITNIIGVTLPFLLTRLRLDPAMASSPLITSIADSIGLVIYFFVASWVLIGPSM